MPPRVLVGVSKGHPGRPILKKMCIFQILIMTYRTLMQTSTHLKEVIDILTMISNKLGLTLHVQLVEELPLLHLCKA